MAVGKLTDIAIKRAKHKDKPYKLADGGGLYLHVKSPGKYWRMDYRFAGKRRTLTFGPYPELSLKDARQRRDDARKQLANHLDPGELKKAKKAAGKEAAENSYELVAREWHARKKSGWSEGYAENVLSRQVLKVFPWLGRRPIREVRASELLKVIRRIEHSGALETAHRTLRECGAVFRYAIASDLAERDPSAGLKGSLPPIVTRHFPSITDPTEVGALLRAIDGFSGHFVTRCALRLAPMLMARPGELRQAEWKGIDLEAAEWRYIVSKVNSQQIVPLATQAVEILKELHPLTGQGRYVFPSIRNPRGDRPMSENTVNAALRRLGYSKNEMTGHGFRSMASTILHEQGWRHELIETQLSHLTGTEVSRAYNYATHLPERRKMMQAWADYLGELKSGGKVIPIRQNLS